MNESQSVSAPRYNRIRPPRVLSEEQQLMLRIRTKISRDDNRHHFQDRIFLKENRQTNRDTRDLMLAFDRVSTRYNLFTVYKIHELLSRQGVEKPSSIIDDGAICAALTINKTPFGFSPTLDRRMSFREEPALLINYALTAGADRDYIVNIVEERGFNNVSEVKAFLAVIRTTTHQSLATGAL